MTRGRSTDVDVVVIGAGQAGLAVGYYLRRRTELSFVMLDAHAAAGGAWPQRWESLRLFSPAGYSSLPGWLMPAFDGYPTREHVVDYLTRYEARYDLPVRRPVHVTAVDRDGDQLMVKTDAGRWSTRAVISATGSHPWTPDVAGAGGFAGQQLHAADYDRPDRFSGLDVVIVGGGNTGAQVLAEVSTVARTTWVTDGEPRFMADDIDGRALFDAATERRNALRDGRQPRGAQGLGDVVMVDAVKDARERGVLVPHPPLQRLTPDGVAWPDGTEQHADAVIWCTGYRPALQHLAALGVLDTDGRVTTDGSPRTRRDSRLWLVGYGDWTGFASATLIGVGRTARHTVEQVNAAVGGRAAA